MGYVQIVYWVEVFPIETFHTIAILELKRGFGWLGAENTSPKVCALSSTQAWGKPDTVVHCQATHTTV